MLFYNQKSEQRYKDFHNLKIITLFVINIEKPYTSDSLKRQEWSVNTLSWK
jgi:hypothetical protein